ncbi:hypothetical protein [Anaerolentibacter hominis]|uniref:hypothetical protein n=1 Tax=Anaerolentibacter hominis TaxID=3079009 RepID=UPI0031B84D87
MNDYEKEIYEPSERNSTRDKSQDKEQDAVKDQSRYSFPDKREDRPGPGGN